MDESGLKEIVESGRSDLTPAEVQKLSKAIVKYPEKAEYLVARGGYYDLNGDNDKAINDFDRAIALDASHADWFKKRGDAYRFSDRYEKALEDYSRAIKLDSNNSGLFTARGDCYVELGQLEQAEKDYIRAIKLSDTSEEQETERPNRAITVDQEMFVIEKSYLTENAREALVNVYIFQGKNDQALSWLEDFKFQNNQSFNNNAFKILPQRALLKALMGKKEEALSDYRLALTNIDIGIADDDDSGPGLLVARLKLAKRAGLLNKEERDKYLKRIRNSYLKQINSRDQSEAEAALGGRARFFLDEGMKDEAEKDKQKVEGLYTQKVQQSPKEAESLLDRGNYFVFVKEPEKALADFRKAAALDPENELYQERVIAQLIELKRFDELEPLLKEGLNSCADNWILLLARAKLLEHRGELDDALIAAKRALENNRYDADVHETIASIQRKKGLVKEAEASEFKARFYRDD